jgi:hypothetical protein
MMTFQTPIKKIPDQIDKKFDVHLFGETDNK